jgi:hypothetical protein
MAGTIKLEQAIARQEAHIVRMVEQNPASPSIRSAKRIAFMLRAELEYAQAGKKFDLAAYDDAKARSYQEIG